MKETRTPMAVLLSRIRRQITYLKVVVRNRGIALPPPLVKLLATQLPESVRLIDRKRLTLYRRQERELRALLGWARHPITGSSADPENIAGKDGPSPDSTKKRRRRSGVSKIYDSKLPSAFPVVGGMIESNRHKH